MVTLNLFTTITNANFDNESIIKRIKDTLARKEELLSRLENKEALPTQIGRASCRERV